MSPGVVTACSTCRITPVAPSPITTCSSRTPTCPAINERSRSGRNSGYRLAASIDSINAVRTAGSGGNGFSLSDNANGFTASGNAPTASVTSSFASAHRARCLNVAAVAAAPPDGGGAGEVTGVRERRHHHHIALLQLAVGDGAVEVDRDARGEQVAALVERVAVPLLGQFQRLPPVAQEHPVGLVGDEQVDILGFHADSVTDGVEHTSGTCRLPRASTLVILLSVKPM